VENISPEEELRDYLQETLNDALKIQMMVETPGWQVMEGWLDEQIETVHTKLMEDDTGEIAVHKARGALEVLLSFKGQVKSYLASRIGLERELRKQEEE